MEEYSAYVGLDVHKETIRERRGFEQLFIALEERCSLGTVQFHMLVSADAASSLATSSRSPRRGRVYTSSPRAFELRRVD